MNYKLPLNILHVADLHLLSARLHDKGDALHRVSLQGDGKVLPYSAEIVEAFTWYVLRQKPDLLVISGDLTFNGELESHLDVVEQLHRIQSGGIPVALIPGNHDIAIASAAAFLKGSIRSAPSISEPEFLELYRAFGYDRARWRDPASFSCILELNDGLRLALIDTNTRLAPGRISPATLEWLDRSLGEASAQGETILTATHQNILVHNEKFTRGFIIDNHLELMQVLDKYRIRLNLSGHIHLQHLALTPEGLNETATGALSAFPHLMAHVTIDEELVLQYRTESLNVSGWAAGQRVNDPNLMDFEAFSSQYFYGISALKTGADLLQDPSLSEPEVIRMAEFAAEVTRAYFSGTLHLLLQDPQRHQGYRLWEEKGRHLRFWHYLNSFLIAPLKNENELRLSLRPKP
ncbi:metallophosphoesterase [Clostridiaceae bacterium HFYG-1003]|nr:metallophosphoesterase [Clostridiaceae bacterium HFYG-1003]